MARRPRTMKLLNLSARAVKSKPGNACGSGRLVPIDAQLSCSLLQSIIYLLAQAGQQVTDVVHQDAV